jgi:hypothetical protein
LKSIVIPSSVVVFGKESFTWCRSLESVTCESGSRLERINKSIFKGFRVHPRSVAQESARIILLFVEHFPSGGFVTTSIPIVGSSFPDPSINA